MKIAVIGSRKFTAYDEFEASLQFRMAEEGCSYPYTIISGGAKGVDTMAARFAKEHRYDFILFKPYHLIDSAVEYSPKYFFTRNKQIADNADLVIAFWDGQSSGTRHMIEYCQRNRKKIIVTTVLMEVEDE